MRALKNPESEKAAKSAAIFAVMCLITLAIGVGIAYFYNERLTCQGMRVGDGWQWIDAKDSARYRYYTIIKVHGDGTADAECTNCLPRHIALIRCSDLDVLKRTTKR